MGHVSAVDLEMIEFIYASAARKPFSPPQLKELLTKARINNQKLGVSGLLLYHQGSFFQMLEGEESAVSSLYDKIAKDPRHHRLVLIKRSTTTERTFADWSMGFVEVNAVVAKSLDGFNAFLQQGHLETKQGADQVRKVLRQFRDGEWRQHVA